MSGQLLFGICLLAASFAIVVTIFMSGRGKKKPSHREAGTCTRMGICAVEHNPCNGYPRIVAGNAALLLGENRAPPHTDYIDIVFEPLKMSTGPDELLFVETEDADGKSICAGEWVDRADGFSALRIHRPEPALTIHRLIKDGKVLVHYHGHHPDLIVRMSRLTAAEQAYLTRFAARWKRRDPAARSINI